METKHRNPFNPSCCTLLLRAVSRSHGDRGELIAAVMEIHDFIWDSPPPCKACLQAALLQTMKLDSEFGDLLYNKQDGRGGVWIQTVSKDKPFPLAWDNSYVKELGVLLNKNTRMKRQNIDKRMEMKITEFLPPFPLLPPSSWCGFSPDRKTGWWMCLTVWADGPRVCARHSSGCFLEPSWAPSSTKTEELMIG